MQYNTTQDSANKRNVFGVADAPQNVYTTTLQSSHKLNVVYTIYAMEKVTSVSRKWCIAHKVSFNTKDAMVSILPRQQLRVHIK